MIHTPNQPSGSPGASPVCPGHTQRQLLHHPQSVEQVARPKAAGFAWFGCLWGSPSQPG